MTLASRYEGLVCDLDGVVYRGPDAVDHAVEALEAVRATGAPVVYATNNAARPPEQVAEHLRELGLTCEAADVVNSSQAAAGILGETVEAGAVVLAVGGPGVAQALREAGYEPVTPRQRIDDPQVAARIAAVVQGYGPDIAWADLAEAAYAIHDGAAWVATNTDLSIPTARGVAPGNGSLVRAVGYAVDVEPRVAGKPHPPLYEASARRVGRPVERMLAVGDRLDTDIEGAHHAGMDSVLVLTGVDGIVAAAQAHPQLRPTYVGADLRVLLEDYPRQDTDGGTCTCGTASAQVRDGRLVVSGGGLDAARAALAAVWSAVDEGTLDAQLTDQVRGVLAGLDPSR